MAGDTTLSCTSHQNFLMQVVTVLQESQGNVLPFSDEVAIAVTCDSMHLSSCGYFGPRSVVEPLLLM